MKKDALIIVRGGGDLATGTIHRLCSAGLRVLVLETTQPAAIRRQSPFVIYAIADSISPLFR